MSESHSSEQILAESSSSSENAKNNRILSYRLLEIYVTSIVKCSHRRWVSLLWSWSAYLSACYPVFMLPVVWWCRCSICVPKFVVENAEGDTVFTITGACCRCQCICWPKDIKFQVSVSQWCQKAYTSKCSVPYWSNPPCYYLFDILALWRSGLSGRVPECQKIKKRWLDQSIWRWTLWQTYFCRSWKKCGTERVKTTAH